MRIAPRPGRIAVRTGAQVWWAQIGNAAGISGRAPRFRKPTHAIGTIDRKATIQAAYALGGATVHYQQYRLVLKNGEWVVSAAEDLGWDN